MTRILVAPPLGLRYEGKPWSMGDHPDAALYRSGSRGLSVITSTDGGKLHMSIAHQERYPHWDDIMAVWRWYAGPDVEGVIVLPRESDYVNLHPNCFHVWESRCGEEGR